MLQQLKQEIVDGLKETKKRGELTAKDIHETVRNAIVHSTHNLKQGSEDVRKTTSEAIKISIQTLVTT